MAITFVKVKVANMANPKRSRRFAFLAMHGSTARRTGDPSPANESTDRARR
jgi:hypothetical protein